jgi:hypothetical protein
MRKLNPNEMKRVYGGTNTPAGQGNAQQSGTASQASHTNSTSSGASSS